ncbi:MAG: class I adenylate-forming enzyme family protein [Thermoanaerobaculia bacterium]
MFADPILGAFDGLFACQPERPLVASSSRLATVGDVHRQAAELADRLHEHALVPGRLVGLVAPNGPGFLVGYLALRRLGLVPVLCDVAVPPQALESILARFDVAGCLSLADAWPRGGEHWTFVTRLGAVVRHLCETTGAVKLTSGSTGEPRGVVVSASALVADESQLAAAMGLTADDRHVGAIPFSHSYGFSSLVMPALVRGALVVVPDERSMMAPLVAARDLEATFFPAVPAWLSGWARLASPPPLPPSIRLLTSAGAPLSPATARAVRERFGQPVQVFYGASESGGIAFDREGTAAERGTVGSLIDGVSIELDAESGRLRVRSAAVADGYLPEAAAELGGGSFLTGDLAAWDEDRTGELRLSGRADDLVIVKGKNVQPREVENLLRGLPGVEDVCVLGVDGPEGPRTVLRAVFGATASAVTFESVVEHCRGRLAEHKIPRSVVVLPELPRDGRGKLDRRQLADPALASVAAIAAGGAPG